VAEGEALAPCPSCEGYGWFPVDEGPAAGVRGDSGGSVDCDWCAGCGYVYRDARGVDRRIPPADYARVAAALERLEAERLRKLGYSGRARRPGQD